MAEEARYRLAPLREARARDERGKRGDLAAAVGDANDARERLEAARGRSLAARDALAAAVGTRDALLASGSTPARVAATEQFVERRRRELAALVGEELRLAAARDTRDTTVDVARATLARARAEREVIERHFVRWREARHKAADRRDD